MDDYALIHSASVSLDTDLPVADLASATIKRTKRVSDRSETTTSGFDALATVWERETRNSSNLEENQNHWAYQAILRMGPAVVPDIINRMRTHKGFWFAALAQLAKWDPVLPEEWGNAKKMRDAWYRFEESPDAKHLRRAGPRCVLWSVSETA